MEGKSSYDVILAFAYGEGRKMNDQLADICIRASGESIPIVTQRDLVAPIVENSQKGMDMMNITHEEGLKIEGWMKRHPTKEFYMKPTQLMIISQRKYISSLDIIKRFLKLAKAFGWTKVLIIAAPQHLSRCVKDFCMESEEGYFDDIIPYDHGRVDSRLWYDSRDPQRWVRGPIIWGVRDAILSFLPWNLYKKIALQEEG